MRILIVTLAALSAQLSFSQNYDLENNKHWNQLMQLNPSMTAIGGELRTIINDVNGINAGFETPFLKRKSSLGMMYQRAGVKNLNRDRVMALLAGKKLLKNESTLRVGVNAMWNRLQLRAPTFGGYEITDFSGNRYQVDSALHAARRADASYLDLGFGLSYERKNLIFGLDARQLTAANISPFNGVETQLRPQVSAQLGGYFGKRADRNWFPQMVYSLEDGDQYLQLGVSHMRKHLSFSGITEMYQGNTTLSFRLNFRKGRFFLSLEYADDANALNIIEWRNMNYAFNFSIFKNKEQNTLLLQKLRLLY